jgi:hypothetical protein
MHILVNPATRQRTGRAAAETRNKPNLHQPTLWERNLLRIAEIFPVRIRKLEISCLVLFQMLYII